MKKLAIITTHPIQYHAPWFRLLAQRNKITIKVFYTWSQVQHEEKFDPGFNKNIEWDLPLLDGYDYTFVRNISSNPGSHHFKGINNPTLTNEIVQWNPDAILVFGWNFKSHLQAMRYFHKKLPVLFRGDSTLLDEKKNFYFRKIVRRISLRWIYHHVDIALYTGKANKEYFLKHGIKDKQLFFAPHAIDNDRFQKKETGNWKEVLKIPGNAIVFLFSGKFEKKKNPLLLLEAFIKLDEPNTHLVFTGNGELKNLLQSQTQKLNELIRNRIHFIGFQNQSVMPEIYHTANVLVLPSKGPGETWGLSVNEAMASGLAIIVSDKCGCHLDLVHNDINGFVFSSNNKNELAEKMKQLINENTVIRMGVKSVEIIREWSFKNLSLAVEKAIQ